MKINRFNDYLKLGTNYTRIKKKLILLGNKTTMRINNEYNSVRY